MGRRLRDQKGRSPRDSRANRSVHVADQTRGRDNNFDLLRLAAAVAVVVSHSFAVVGRPEPLHQFHTTLGSVGVLVFFAVSGLLIHRSWQHDPRASAFWTKRFLRLWPALIMATVATALILGPVVTTAPLRDYFSSRDTWTYPLWYVFMTPFGAELPGVFVDMPAERAVNGALWTLHIEVLAYGILFALGITSVLGRRIIVAILAAAALLWAGHIVTPTQPNLGAVNAIAAFAVGACVWSWRDRVVLSHWGALATMAVCVATAAGPDSLRVVTWTLGAAYIAFWFAYVLPRLGRRLTKWGDASYGLYIIAFPVQQTIVQLLGSDISPWVVSAIALPVVWLLAIASWRFVERPALQLKSSSTARSQSARQLSAEPCFQAAGARFQSP